jgi:outer membrane protein OmpA-like peptidoglycan-associated protein
MRKIVLLFSFLFIIQFNLFSQLKEIFRDDFNVLKDWPTDDDAYISNGLYHVNSSGGLLYKFAVRDIIFNYFEDYFIETSFKQSKGEENSSAGLIWGHFSKNNTLIFSVSSEGWFKIHGKRQGRPFIIKSRTYLDSGIKPYGQLNKLSIRKAGNKFHFFINGKLIHTSLFYIPFGKQCGIISMNGADVEADYFLVKAKQNEINLVAKSISKYSKENIGLNVNSPYKEIAPVISPDGKTLYIARADHPKNVYPKENFDIWYSTLNENGTWGQLKHMGKPLNNSGDNVVISVSPDNNTLFLETVYNADGSYYTDQGISVSYRTKTGWSIPKKVNIQNYYNKNIFESFAFSPNRKVLVMSVERNDSYGDKDMYVSFLLSDRSYSEPKNMGPVLNSFLGEGTPYIAPDNKTLYFYSNTEMGYGSADIFVSKRLDDSWTKWSKPQNLGKKVNTEGWDVYYTVSAKGDYAYLVSATNTYGNEDIFRLKLRDIEKPDPVVLVYGKVIDKKTGKPIDASVVYENSQTGKSEGIARSNPATGEYKIILPYGIKYDIRADKEGYFALNESMDLRTVKNYKEVEKNLLMASLEDNESILLKDVHFYSTKAILLPGSYSELNRLVKLMKKRSYMYIEIHGHTEATTGYENQLMLLSEKRAKAVRDYLIIKGIDEERIKTKAFGGTKPIADNGTEEGRRLNRRVEFKIIKK